uniref:Uncharacterized protein n=1 Tax=Anopheles maculatus TaxID=74869 RepID=A0A182SR32_9DIPT
MAAAGIRTTRTNTTINIAAAAATASTTAAVVTSVRGTTVATITTITRARNRESKPRTDDYDGDGHEMLMLSRFARESIRIRIMSIRWTMISAALMLISFIWYTLIIPIFHTHMDTVVVRRLLVLFLLSLRWLVRFQHKPKQVHSGSFFATIVIHTDIFIQECSNSTSSLLHLSDKKVKKGETE